MATKPTELGTWNTSGANRTNPSAGQKLSGYTLNQVPTSGEFNWLMFYLWSWIAYLNSITSTKWIYLPATCATYVSANVDRFSTALIGQTGFSHSAHFPLQLPVGARVLKVAAKWRHSTGEGAAPGAMFGGIALVADDTPADGLGGSNGDSGGLATVLQGDPPAGIPAAYTMTFYGNNSAGQLWDTTEAVVDQDDPRVVVTDEVPLSLYVGFSGTQRISWVAVQVQIDE